MVTNFPTDTRLQIWSISRIERINIKYRNPDRSAGQSGFLFHGLLSCLPLQPVVKRISYTRAKGYLSVMDRIESYQVHFFYLRLAVITEIFLITDYVDYFSYQIISRC